MKRITALLHPNRIGEVVHALGTFRGVDGTLVPPRAARDFRRDVRKV